MNPLTKIHREQMYRFAPVLIYTKIKPVRIVDIF